MKYKHNTEHLHDENIKHVLHLKDKHSTSLAPTKMHVTQNYTGLKNEVMFCLIGFVEVSSRRILIIIMTPIKQVNRLAHYALTQTRCEILTCVREIDFDFDIEPNFFVVLEFIKVCPRPLAALWLDPAVCPITT